MSDEKASQSGIEGSLDLSGLNFGPAWARDPSESKSLKKFKDRSDRDDRRGGGRERDDRRGGGRGEQQRGGGPRGYKKGGRGRRDDERRPRREEVEPPEGVSVKLMPAEESLDLLAKRVIESGQTFSVFDLAKVLLQSRDRFRVTFESAGKPLIRCREDQSIWLGRDEALRQLWRAEWLTKFYEEVQVEGEAPKGNFSSVARCGLSNELLGPPNYHGYQERLTALHRERFSHLPLEAYKAKVQVEHGEEAVEAWLESMKTVTKWKVAAPKEEPEENAAESEEAAESKEEETTSAVAAPAESEGSATGETPAGAEETAEDSKEGAEAEPESEGEEPETVEEKLSGEDETPDESPDADEAGTEEEAPQPAELFDDLRAVERHFAENHYDAVFEETDRAWVMGDIRGNLLSPGLLTLLKRTVAEEKRYPAHLMPVVCRQLSGRHVAVFKWNKKLKVGPSRPHAVPTDTQLAERPRAIIDHLTKHSGVALKEFWEAVMPAEVTAEQKHDWLQDFQWLLGEGHIILLSDTTVHLAKKPEKSPAPTAKSEPSKPNPNPPSEGKDGKEESERSGVPLADEPQLAASKSEGPDPEADEARPVSGAVDEEE